VVLIDMTYLYSEMLGALIVDNNQSWIPWYVASQKKRNCVLHVDMLSTVQPLWFIN
jgi:hypothetical protein